MKPGTQGFVGERLREAREARGLTITSLAELTTISKQSISDYEHGKATPHPDHSIALADKLNLPIAFFLDEYSYEDTSPIYNRSMASATKGPRIKSRRRYDWLRRVVGFLSQYVEFPKLDLPMPLTAEHSSLIRPEDIEAAAERARIHFGLGVGPIDNITWLLENHGVVIGLASFGSAYLDSFSQVCSDGRAYAIINAEAGSAVRYRYDLAHELGHLCLHRNLDPRQIQAAAIAPEIERQANAFAGEFLMPSKTFAKTFRAINVDGLKPTKLTWKVSMQAALMHALRLGLVTKEQSERMWRSFAARGWRKSEPFDNVMEPEQPELLRGAFDAVLQNGVTPAEICDALPFTAWEIETLCGLEPGKLGAKPTVATAVRLTPAPSRQPQRPDRVREPKGDVVAFRRPDRS
jgi:Zn-dependent peptidase ImmA (M78 family)/transcriptional regulator with XRE-family HTH domain